MNHEAAVSSSSVSGESNAGYNNEIYACTFYEMINDWRAKWAHSDPDFPFGSVQLGNNIGEKGVPIRWHQTNDKVFSKN